MSRNLPMGIDYIEFGVFSPEDFRKLSVSQIITADTYDEDGLPINSGLMDSRLGTIEPSRRCKTCGNRVGDCQGHFGHIELTRPVIHEGFAKSIQRILRATCRSCSRLMLTEEDRRSFIDDMKKYEKMHKSLSETIGRLVDKKATKARACPFCDEPQLKIKLEKPTTFYEQMEEGNFRLTPVDIRERFERIPDEDIWLMGVNPKAIRPEWMILTVLPVSPVCVRPSITLESGVRSEDDLTHKLVDVIRINQRLRENIDAGAPQLIVEDLWELLQYHVTTYFNNEVSGIPPARHRSGRALRTLTQRLKGKEGRFRSNLSGKRVDFSARTVISPDPNLGINDVGVPEALAKILTIPEMVTEWKIEEIKELVKNGPEVHPGANYLIRPDGKRFDLRIGASREAIADTIVPPTPGQSPFIVERHLQEGDIVLFNRQPSLHRMSIMAHQVRVMPSRTFRLHLTVCPPYNADFDGDEMNLHVPQGEEARAEARTLMRVQEQILSPRYGGPIIGGIQDFISGSFMLTRKSTLLRRDEVNQLLIASGMQGQIPPPAISYPVELWTGKQIFSLYIPKGLNISFKAKVHPAGMKGPEREDSKTDSWVVIRDGVLLAGVIDEKAIGAHQPETMFHRIVKDYGTDAAREFLDSYTRMLIEFITKVGISVGNDNVELSREAKLRIKEILQRHDEKVENLIDTYRRGEFGAAPGRSTEETLEMRIQAELAEGRDQAGDAASEYLGLDNHAVIMAKSGARGKMLNLAQMASCVGQQSVRGERITRGLQDRTLPHFIPGDLGSKAHGFINASYIQGLSPIEFFFHAMGGREGLVDTAVRTSTSGYLQRRLINALQDIKVEYDNTVRNAEGRIIQMKYGDDGVDPSKSDHGKAVNIDIIIEKVLAKEGK